jgi:hypothetical protein
LGGGGVSFVSFGAPVVNVVIDENEETVIFGESAEGFIELFNDAFGGGDEVVKSGNLILEGSSLFIEVSFEGVPISLGLVFSVKFSFLGGGEGVSDGFQEVEDSDDLFVIELSRNGSESRDKGFEEGGVFSVSLKGFFNFGISFSNLGEGDTVDQMFDEFGGFFEGGNGFRVFEIGVNPGSVFSFSLGGSSFEGSVGFV